MEFPNVTYNLRNILSPKNYQGEWTNTVVRPSAGQLNDGILRWAWTTFPTGNKLVSPWLVARSDAWFSVHDGMHLDSAPQISFFQCILVMQDEAMLTFHHFVYSWHNIVSVPWSIKTLGGTAKYLQIGRGIIMTFMPCVKVFNKEENGLQNLKKTTKLWISMEIPVFR